jgi:branched-chain amino acid transport system substrate-binding protein
MTGAPEVTLGNSSAAPVHRAGGYVMKRFALPFVVLVSIVVAACGGSGTPTPSGTAASTEPIKIGLLAATTSGNALLGESYRGGVAFAVKEINAAGGIKGRQIVVKTSDIGGDNTTAVNALNEAVADNPVVLIGHPHSTAQIAQNALIKKTGVPFFYSGSSVKVTQSILDNPWIFRISPNDGVMATAATQYVLDKLKYTKVAILYSNEEFGIAGRDVITEVLAKRGLKPVAQEAHEVLAQDVSAQLLKLKTSGAEIIIGWATPIPTAATLRQLKELQINIPYMGGRSMALAAVLGLSKAEQLDGAYGSVDSVISVDPLAAEWTKKYKADTGKEPDFFTAAYYDLVYMIKDWIGAVGTDPAALRKAILETQNRKGVGSNIYSFKPTGESVFTAQVIKYTGSTPKILETVTVAP